MKTQYITDKNLDTEEIFTEKAHALKPGLLSVKTSEPVIIYSGS